ncbi:exodeoxyribonuclease VII large subunit [Polycladidibacter stylochi]|uniref:exodeoxyribonuclease VII large subunit n=1 Tax=Polycladidibacter stylochi TaxID=1807766 RepID=UPI000AF54EC8|nr:exodeoxyribonuclease VII large subunit [Pseudovibrio stylochi]
MSALDTTEKTNITEYSVSEISGAIKRTVEDSFDYVRVRGELGRVSSPASGHVYLDLKDDRSVLNGVIWRGNAAKMKVKPEQGLEVIATGKITTFPGQSKYQMVIDSMEPAGAGALMALLEERKKKLAAEGLFAPERKQNLPKIPMVVGVVTSPTGAVIRDILHRIQDRFPLHVMVWPVRVQGETCGDEVARGIAGFNSLSVDGTLQRPDVIIVARGGGSLEDLWGFNDEVVVRAAAASQIPLISAVGHETDWTLLDYVADVRAPTPTGAAEFAVPVKSELLASLDDYQRRLFAGTTRYLQSKRTELRAAEAYLPSLRDLLALPRQQFDMTCGRLGPSLAMNTQSLRSRYIAAAHQLSPFALKQKITHSREHVGSLSQRLSQVARNDIAQRKTGLSSMSQLLQSLSYRSVLERGYAILRDADGQAIRTTKAIANGSIVEAELSDGKRTLLAADVLEETEQAGGAMLPTPTNKGAGLADRTDPLEAHRQERLQQQKPKKRKKKAADDSGAQGSLF